MIRKIIKKILFAPSIAKLLLVPTLKLHNFSYFLSGSFARITESGIHPKHSILKYKEWFLSNVETTDVVLDIGCNTGSLPAMLASKVNYVYGIEISEPLITEAKKNNQLKNIDYIMGDATLYDYSKLKPISIITLSNVLEHIDKREEFLKKIINQVHWRNGIQRRILIRVPMIDRDWLTIYKKNKGVEWRLDNTHFTEYTLAQFQQEMQDSNISILNYRIQYGEIYAQCFLD